jgi:hypothetical protein
MDYRRALELEKMMYQELYKKENKFTLNCWNLSANALTGSVHDRLKHQAIIDPYNDAPNHVLLARIKTYKHKKLS